MQLEYMMYRGSRSYFARGTCVELAGRKLLLLAPTHADDINSDDFQETVFIEFDKAISSFVNDICREMLLIRGGGDYHNFQCVQLCVCVCVCVTSGINR